MSFDQFYTYNAEEWYPEELVCSACHIHVEEGNLQALIDWATEHLKVCEPKKWTLEELVYPEYTTWREVYSNGEGFSDRERAERQLKIDEYKNSEHYRFRSFEEIREETEARIDKWKKDNNITW